MSVRAMKIKASLFLSLAAVVLAPLPFGMVETPFLVMYAVVIVTAIILALFEYDVLSSSAFDRRMYAAILLIILAFVAVAFVQNATSGWWPGHQIWNDAGAVLGRSLPGRISVVADSPFRSLGLPLSMLATFFLFYEHGRSGDNKLAVLRVLAWSGLGYGVLSATLLLISPDMLLWRTKLVYLSNLTGPFVNRNTAGTYFGGCSLIFLMLSLRYLRQRLGQEPMTFVTVLALLSSRVRRSLIAPMAGFFICLTFTLMTGSRAASLLTLFSAGLLTVLYMQCYYGRVISAPVVLSLVAPILILVVVVAGSAVTHRLGRQGLDDEARITLYLSVIKAIGQHPLLGTGLGTFADALPLTRDADLPSMVVWDKAHNSFLELAMEGGLPLALLVLAFYIFCGIRLWSLRQSSFSQEADAGMLAFSVGVLACLHSLIDFSLQIPGYALVFSAIVGVASSRLNSATSNGVYVNQKAKVHE